MKIGILTFHRTANDGSVLQNWCLQQLLKSLAPGAHVETIDLRDKRREALELRRLLTRRPPFLQIEAVRKMRGLRRFLKDNVVMSPTLTTASLDEGRRFVERQDYDVVVCGSDTVWQMAPVGSAAPPHLYFLPGFSGFRKVAYAASADPISDRSVFDDPEKRESVARAVSDFSIIGVRDEPTVRALEILGIDRQRIEFTPDPTVMIDFRSLVGPVPRREGGRPVAGIALQSRTLARTLSDVLQARGWHVINHLGPTPPGAQSLSGSETMGQRLARFASQDLLVTDRFHSSIFTLKLGAAPVVFVESPAKWPEPDSKGRDLLERLGCVDHVWRPGGAPDREFLSHLELVEAWRQSPPDMAARFAELRDSAKPALDRLKRAIDG